MGSTAPHGRSMKRFAGDHVAATDASHVAAVWDRLSRRYDLLLAPLELLFLRRWRRRVVAAVGGAHYVLEVGAGTGLNFRHYAPDARGVATDLSLGMIAAAAKRTRPPGVKIVVADAERLPFRDSTFDVVIATLVFCSVPDDIAGFDELRRVLAPAGRFTALEHVRPPRLGGRLFDWMNRWTSAHFGDHINRRPSETLSRHGFEVELVHNKAGAVFQFIVARTRCD